jgi:hemin uptake protein HemP
MPDQEPASYPPGQAPAHEEAPLIVTSAEVLRGRREIWIEHGQDMYRLRLTAAGNLYLTK